MTEIKTLPTIHLGDIEPNPQDWRDVLNDENDPDPDDENVHVAKAFIAVLGFDPAEIEEE